MASSARLDELRKKFEENPRRYFAPLANEYRKAGEIDQAIAICREHLPQQPGHMSGHIVFGQALYEARQFEEAKTVFETALSLDPENLIALRQLGDIALITGNSEAARSWYGRVLEADPRNEEIQAQLKTLDQAASTAPTPAITPAIPATVAMKPVLAPVTATSPTAEIRLDEIIPRVEPREEKAAEPTLEIATTSLTESALGAATSGSGGISSSALEGLESTNAVAGTDAPPLDSFSLDGLETTSLSSAPEPPADLELLMPPPSTPAAPAARADLPAPPSVSVPSLELNAPADGPEPLDLELGSLGAPAPQAITQTPSTPPPPLPESPSAPPVPEPIAELEFQEPTAVEPAAPDSGPFVTETMAELYLQQGHREEALRVYRALAEQRPSDAALRQKVAWLEAELLPPAAVAAQPPASAVRSTVPAPLAAPASGPTIRELLNVMALRRPGYRPELPQGNGAAPALEVPGGGLPVAEPAADTIGMTFGFGPPSPGDESAAAALALAFSSNGQSSSGSMISGAAARPAPGELSLDTVFKGGEAPPPAPSNFSFDQFFSERATSEHRSVVAPNASTAESPEEIAQFTHWLEGLKRR